jgi:Helix-turn-helix
LRAARQRKLRIFVAVNQLLDLGLFIGNFIWIALLHLGDYRQLAVFQMEYQMTIRENRKRILADKLKGWRKRDSRWRKQHGRPLTQALVAELLGVSQGYISKLESGAIAPDFLDVERLACLYGKKLRHLKTLSPDEARQLNPNHYRTYP